MSFDPVSPTPALPALRHSAPFDNDTEPTARSAERTGVPDGAPRHMAAVGYAAAYPDDGVAHGARSPERNGALSERTAPFALPTSERTALPRYGAPPERTPHSESAPLPYPTRRSRAAARAAERALMAQRATEEALALRERAASDAARRKEKTIKPASPEEIAPVPPGLLKTGVWLDRTIGVIPLMAPLAVSGFFTAQSFMSDPLNVPWPVAVAFTLALEGSAWRLSRIYERTLREGDSTIGVRLGIYMILGGISSVIFWHAAHVAATAGQSVFAGSGWIPAAASAAMSILGVYVWGRVARHQHRVELRARGLVDKQAPRFTALSWLLHPRQTFGALRHAVRHRLDSPIMAIEDHALWRAAGRPEIWPPIGAQTAQSAGESAARAEAREERAMALAAQSAPGYGAVRSDRTAHPAAQSAAGNGAPYGALAPVRSSFDDLRHGAEPTAQSAPATAHPASVNGAPASDTERATRATAQSAPDGADGADLEIDADAMKYAADILDLAAAFPNWRTTLPSQRSAVAAIDSARKRRDPDSGFNSGSQVRKILAAMDRIRGDADALDTLSALSETISD